MKYKELFPDKKNNYSKAKRISMMAKEKAKKNNPGETETPSGWSADPHQGEFHALGPLR